MTDAGFSYLISRLEREGRMFVSAFPLTAFASRSVAQVAVSLRAKASTRRQASSSGATSMVVERHVRCVRESRTAAILKL